MIGRGCPEPEREFLFHFRRKWRFDFAWRSVQVAVELQGGEYAGGRHGRGTGLTGDCEKFFHAAAGGWRIFPMTYTQAKDPDMLDILAATVRRLLSE